MQYACLCYESEEKIIGYYGPPGSFLPITTVIKHQCDFLRNTQTRRKTLPCLYPASQSVHFNLTASFLTHNCFFPPVHQIRPLCRSQKIYINAKSNPLFIFIRGVSDMGRNLGLQRKANSLSFLPSEPWCSITEGGKGIFLYQISKNTRKEGRASSCTR